MLVHMVKYLSIVFKLTLHCVSYCVYGTQHDINAEKKIFVVFIQLKIGQYFYLFFNLIFFKVCWQHCTTMDKLKHLTY